MSSKKSNSRTCDNCRTEDGPLRACSRCGLVFYCSRECQAAHWKIPETGHKLFCVSKAEKNADIPTTENTLKKGEGGNECPICLEPLDQKPTVSLPSCGHVLHSRCYEQMIKFCVQSACPLCRAPLLSVSDSNYFEATIRCIAIETKVFLRKESWLALSSTSKRDMKEIIRLYKEAAELGHTGALFNLGVLYLNGFGVKKSDNDAISYFQKGSKLGHAESCLHLGIFYEQARGGLRQSLSKAFECYTIAAEKGSSEAQYCLGVMHLMGQGIPQDDSQAAIWFRAAAEKSHMQAQHNLAILLDTGRGLPKNTELATSYYRAAALQGDDHAQVALGKRYHSGTGCLPKDMFEAEKWYKLAQAQGTDEIVEVSFLLGQLYENEFKDMKRALFNYQLSYPMHPLASMCIRKLLASTGQPTSHLAIEKIMREN